MTTTLRELRKLLKAKFHGRLSAGKHVNNGKCCALELLSAYRRCEWTDDPLFVRCFDFRWLNDVRVSDELRTKHLLPVIAAYDGSLDWTDERQHDVAERIVIGIVREIICDLPRMSDDIRYQCRNAITLQDAEAAARSAEYAAARSAARSAAYAAEYAAARSAAYAAEYAVEAAARSADNAPRAERASVFAKACRVFLQAANESK